MLCRCSWYCNAPFTLTSQMSQYRSVTLFKWDRELLWSSFCFKELKVFKHRSHLKIVLLFRRFFLITLSNFFFKIMLLPIDFMNCVWCSLVSNSSYLFFKFLRDSSNLSSRVLPWFVPCLLDSLNFATESRSKDN